MVRKTPEKAERRPRAGSYIPPEHWYTTTLVELLDELRSVPEQQQRPPGVADDSPGYGPPLFYSGDLALVRRPCVAIVGTRSVSPAGAARARNLARDLAKAGVVVVSGLAKGVDTEALTGAIEAGGKTIAVIGTPLDKAYPAENKRLQEEIYREHLLVSQFPWGSRVFQGNFPMRNRVMAAISDMTVIIEAGETSGTLHQAVECNKLGRWLLISRDVVENKALTWPESFIRKPWTRVFSSSEDVFAALRETGIWP